MPATHKKNLLASRRRREDDGEDDASVVGDLEDDSMSEGSALSNVDDDEDEEGDVEAEGSNSSGDEHEQAKAAEKKAKSAKQQGEDGDDHAPTVKAPDSRDPLQPTAGTDVVPPESNAPPKSQEPEELRFEELAIPAGNEATTGSETVIPKAPRHETVSQRSRREHQEYVRQRDANPAFVPTRGGFFLHDDRNSRSSGQHPRTFGRGRGRGFAAPVHEAGRGGGFNEPTNRPWAHDLHEGLETAPREGALQGKQDGLSEMQRTQNPAASTAPNRSFSFSTVLGNVTVQISFPGMAQKISVPNVVKKQHTLLPQHRPPLRRDKPVRISIPDTAPRYIFPSTERSFIFIPRAMRPNQQSYRGRGRGSFHGSRRPSIYGSTYTPSVAMSRKSSVGASTLRDGIRSPADSVLSRMGIPGMESTRPIVRMPSTVPTPSLSRSGMHGLNGQIGMSAPAPPMYGSHSTAIPMHQPRPQKAVSLADIESPASFHFKAPQPQQEQPFHQQVPAHIVDAYAEGKEVQPGQQAAPALAGVAPLSQIPEGAVFAQGYPSYPVMGAPAYFGAPYNPGTLFYPPMVDTNSYGVQMHAPSLAPSFVPGSHSHPVAYMPAPGAVEGGMPPNPVAHESNGMVYYYNPPMFAPDAPSGLQPLPVASNGNMTAMSNRMSGQPPFYLPSAPAGMFYQAQSG
ncbi:hypothetical protein A1O1_06129 [Capronia coronata CBS 617.96]|uniref:Btz domain-containing protein n=1 Tax=Capronia coronata CBS 617.96 TaxID=1182541 RepID=W9Y931_9EURO|nr:uncharacterized protein A1O1_06129 [Capronia coronata CBS 617.96]EXJ85761.1 hypothetical protein A1O1_06129 [Capronia coronata CBS 617.96]